MKHFLNDSMLAPNVLTVPVDMDIVREFTELALRPDPGPDYLSVMPWKDFNDILWISAKTEAAFRVFQSAFERMDVARHVREYLDIDQDVHFYAGFVHTRRVCKKENFHVDWRLTNNEAFTLLTPLCGYENEQKLLYKKLTGEVAEYVYKPGEAIIFGDKNSRQNQVAKRRAEQLNYSMLSDLNTRPRTTYLAELRNPNPALMEGTSG